MHDHTYVSMGNRIHDEVANYIALRNRKQVAVLSRVVYCSRSGRILINQIHGHGANNNMVNNCRNIRIHLIQSLLLLLVDLLILGPFWIESHNAVLHDRSD